MKLNGIVGAYAGDRSLGTGNEQTGTKGSAFLSLLGQMINEPQQMSGNSGTQTGAVSGTTPISTVPAADASQTITQETATIVPDADSTFATDMKQIEAQYGGQATQSQIMEGLYEMDPDALKTFSSHSI
jgi:hypothetical protein